MYSQPPPCQQFILGWQCWNCWSAENQLHQVVRIYEDQQKMLVQTIVPADVVFLWISYLVEMLCSTVKNEQICYHEGSQHHVQPLVVLG